MIKKELIHSSKSYWRNNDLYDSERQKSRTVKIFGLTIWKDTEDFRCDIIEDVSEKIGFKAKEKK